MKSKKSLLMSLFLLILLPSVIGATTTYTMGDAVGGDKVDISRVSTDVFRFQTTQGDKVLDLRLGAQLSGGNTVYMSEFLSNNPGTSITFPVENRGALKKYDIVVDPAPNLANVEYIFLEYYDHSGFDLSKLNVNNDGFLADVLALNFDDARAQNLTVEVNLQSRRILIGQLENAVVDGVLRIDPTATYNPNATGSSAWHEAFGTTSLPGWSTVDATSYTSANLNTVSLNDSNSVDAYGGPGMPPAVPTSTAHRFKIKINESPVNIDSLSIAIKQQEFYENPTVSLYVGNVTGQSWILLDSDSTATVLNQDGIIETDLSDYVETDGSDYYLYVLAFASGTVVDFYHQVYYVQVDVESNDPDVNPPVVSLDSPSNGTSTLGSSAIFNASFTDDIGLLNATFFLWNSTGSVVNQTDFTLSGTSDTESINVTFPYTDVFLWNYQATDSSANSAFNSTNYTLTYSIPSPTPSNSCNTTGFTSLAIITIVLAGLLGGLVGWAGLDPRLTVTAIALPILAAGTGVVLAVIIGVC